MLTAIFSRRTPREYSLNHLPPFQPDLNALPEEAVCKYFLNLVEAHRVKAASGGLKLPSVIELAEYFDYPVMVVVNALYGLRKHYITFEFVGLNEPIILRIPQNNQPRRHALFYQPAWIPLDT